MGPIDYTLPAPPNLAGQFMQGLQGGLAVQQIEAERAQQEAARAQQAQLNADLASAVRDPQQLPGLMTKYPALAEKLKHGWDALNTQQQTSQIQHFTEVGSALQAGAKDVAVDVLRQHATALRNSGNEDGAKATETMVTMAQDHPEQLLAIVRGRLAAIGPAGAAALKGLIDTEMQPAAAREATAKADTAEVGVGTAKSNATTAAVAAKFAESKAIGELKLNETNIKHLEADTEIKRENTRIAVMNANLNREGNDLKRQELKLKVDEAVQKRDDLTRTKVAEVRQGAATLDSLLNTVEQVKKHPALNSVVGPLAGKESYPHTLVGMTTPGVLGAIPDANERADAITLIDQLQSQATLGQLQALKAASGNGSSGFGALSQKELEVIQNGIQSLKRTQSPESFRAKLDEMSRLMKKNRDILESKYGIDAGAPDTPAAGPQPIKTDADFNALPSGAEFIAPDGTRRRKP